MIKLGASQLRTSKADPNELQKLKKNDIYIVLDNVLDTYNIGAIFRLADAVSAKEVILTKGSETPPHTRIKKASINTTEWVSWRYFKKASEAITYLRETVPGIAIYAVEQNQKSVLYTRVSYSFPLALVIGHESEGVSQEALSQIDQIVELPMWGVNKSLNVMVSLGIVLYEAVRHFQNGANE